MYGCGDVLTRGQGDLLQIMAKVLAVVCSIWDEFAGDPIPLAHGNILK